MRRFERDGRGLAHQAIDDDHVGAFVRSDLALPEVLPFLRQVVAYDTTKAGG
jgi:hypothetical protein